MTERVTPMILNRTHRGKKLFDFNYGIAIDGGRSGYMSDTLLNLNKIAKNLLGDTPPSLGYTRGFVKETRRVGWSFKSDYGREYLYFKKKEDMEKVLTFYALSTNNLDIS